MNTTEAFNILLRIEEEVDINSLKWDSFHLWPLLREIIWEQLLSQNTTSTNKTRKDKPLHRLQNIFRRINQYLSLRLTLKFKRNNEEVLFISRPCYLQRTTSGKHFDRIVDPLLYLLKGSNHVEKYYIGMASKDTLLEYPGLTLRPSFLLSATMILPRKQKEILMLIADIAGIQIEELWQKYNDDMVNFLKWYQAAKHLILHKPKLKKIYLTSWYFPDMMGICAAASELNIETIDVQHGKQGKYQAMYSGWQKIPNNGYGLLPDFFWCWGQPSCDHIMATSPDRKTHLPFVGGYLWLDYYKRFLSMPDSNKQYQNDAIDTIHILMTTQPPQGTNHERIPSFILQYLKSVTSEKVQITFRCHPNDINGINYCYTRLKNIPNNLYKIDDGTSNLYDQILQSSLHITAYSSCCYEASVFNVPTLLYGDDAITIYAEEIRQGIFTWTSGKEEDLKNWINNSTTSNKRFKSIPYITSSLSHGHKLLNSNIQKQLVLAADNNPKDKNYQ